jgi:tRNA(Ile)-lysidine synthase TilS/MesJ
MPSPPCSTCGHAAVYTRRVRSISHTSHHADRFCDTCFSEWVERRVDETIRSFEMLSPGDRVLVCLSGEKDSTIMFHLLTAWIRRHRPDVSLWALTVDEGISDYRTRCVEVARGHAVRREVPFITRSYKDRFDKTLDHISQHRAPDDRRICFYCCSLRGVVVREIVEEIGANKVATGLNLSDVAAYALICMIHGNIDNRCLPKHVPSGSNVTFIAPIAGLSAMECWLYGSLNKIEFLNEDCPNSDEHFYDDIKHALAGLEDRSPGVLEALAAGYGHLADTSRRTLPIIQDE